MAIDACECTFSELAATVLPKYMGEMQAAIEVCRPLADFCARGAGVRTILEGLHKTSDFAGCYVLMHKDKAFYVGISRGVIGRLGPKCSPWRLLCVR